MNIKHVSFVLNCNVLKNLIYPIRYRGKKSPDAILADICWWSKTMYENREEKEQEEEEEEEDWQAEAEFDDFIASDEDDFEPEQASKRPREESIAEN